MIRKLSLSAAFVVLMAVMMVTSPIAMAAGGTAGADDADRTQDFTVDDVQTQSGEDVYIESELEQAAAEEDTVEVFVRMDAAESETYAQVTGDAQSMGDSQTALKQEAEITQSQLELHAEELGDDLEIVNEFWITNAALVEVDADRVDELTRIDGVSELHPNYEVEMAQPVATDEQASDDVGPADHGETTYGLDQVNAPHVWDEFDTTGEGVTAAVIDTGVDADHPEFEDYDENNWAEFDFDGSEIDSEPYDVNGHGTHVAGTVLGGNASGPHIGVAPDAELLAINVFPGMPEEGSTTLSAIVAGMEHAVEEGADVANLSLGGGGYAGIYIDVIKNAKESGTHIVSSSGNDGPGSEGTPANVYNGTAVGASDVDRDIADFSTGTEIDTHEEWGFIAPESWPDEYATPDVSAPGVDVYSAVPGGGYSDTYSGTSMAAPHVAGTVALLMAQDDELSPSEAKPVLEETATKPYHEDISGNVIADAGENNESLYDDDVRDIRYGYGIIDAYAASAAIDAQSSEITGNVVDDEGETVSEPTRVTLEEVDREVTSQYDGYAFDVTSGEYELTAADAFGYSDGNATVSVGEDESVEENISVERELDVEQLGFQPDEVEAEEPFALGVHVAHLENLTVDLTDESTVAEENVDIFLLDEMDDADPTELDLGEVNEFEEPVSGLVSIHVDGEAGDMFAFEHTFDGVNNEPIDIETGPITVVDEMEDPESLVIGEHDQLEEDLISNQMRTGNVTIENPANETRNGTLMWDLEGVGVFGDEFEVEPNGEHVTEIDLHLGDDPAPWSFAFGAGDTAEQELTLVDDTGEADHKEFETELVTGSLNGTVTDAETGDPVSGVTVMASDGFNLIETTTDSAGEYHLQPDAPGEWQVMAESGSYGPIQDTVTISEDLDPVEQNLEIGTTPEFTFTVDEGEAASIGLPADVEGGTVDDVVPAEANVIVWAYDTESNEWASVNGTHEVSALDALVVSAAEETELTVEFAGTPTADDTATPVERTVDEGWNFVAPSTFDDPEAAFTSTEEVLRVQQVQDEPQSEMVPDGSFSGVETFDSSGEVNPFAGYFVFVEDDGTMAGATNDGMTLRQAYDNLNYSDDSFDSIEGTVTSTVTNEPIEGAEVSVEGTSLSATTDEDGHYTIPAVFESDDRHVTIDAEGYEAKTLEPSAGELDAELQDKVHFTVNDFSVDETDLEIGDEFEVTYTIENEGSQDAWQIVSTEFGDAVSDARMNESTWQVDSSGIELEAGNSTEVTVTGEVGEFIVTEPQEPQEIGVFTDDDSATVDITVSESSESTSGETAAVSAAPVGA
ncbi:S8 family serine peptidase [Natronorubrum sp. JWXQ-INN-674]|uniref:S8 family serine peptidase n=1 Tax=Natronorubrum halalkaliphilum TaxID=2691917 RepID=A0A6B0VR27_9EURY|nr:S8 family serine peptidase [Natronorubrum halalkaliphilum]MXV62939.1 S8 family serine peptidase [Natronorubrum halalkaliphilum]